MLHRNQQLVEPWRQKPYRNERMDVLGSWLEYYVGKSAQKSQISGSLEDLAFRLLRNKSEPHLPQPENHTIQRGAAERRACNKHLFLGAITRLRLRRAEKLACELPGLPPGTKADKNRKAARNGRPS